MKGYSEMQETLNHDGRADAGNWLSSDDATDMDRTQPISNEDAQKYREIELFLSVEFEEDIPDNVGEEIRHSFCFTACRSFLSSDAVVEAYASYHLGGAGAGDQWSRFELNAFQYCREDMNGYLPQVLIHDGQGEGIAAMMHFRAKVKGASGRTTGAKYPSPLDPLPKTNTSPARTPNTS